MTRARPLPRQKRTSLSAGVVLTFAIDLFMDADTQVQLEALLRLRGMTSQQREESNHHNITRSESRESNVENGTEVRSVSAPQRVVEHGLEHHLQRHVTDQQPDATQHPQDLKPTSYSNTLAQDALHETQVDALKQEIPASQPPLLPTDKSLTGNPFDQIGFRTRRRTGQDAQLLEAQERLMIERRLMQLHGAGASYTPTSFLAGGTHQDPSLCGTGGYGPHTPMFSANALPQGYFSIQQQQAHAQQPQAQASTNHMAESLRAALLAQQQSQRYPPQGGLYPQHHQQQQHMDPQLLSQIDPHYLRLFLAQQQQHQQQQHHQQPQPGPLLLPHMSLPDAMSGSLDDDSRKNGRRPSRAKAVKFPVKLMRAILAFGKEDAVEWLPDGRSFAIVNQESFIQKVLQQEFKNSKYTSFVRKLNRWGFIRLTAGNDVDCFHHKYFRQDRPQDAGLIRALPRAQKKKAPQTAGDTAEKGGNSSDEDDASVSVDRTD